MLVVTTNDIPGWEIQRVCGEVFGLTVRSRNMFSQMGAGFKSMFGGELQGMTKNLADSRNEVMGRMLEHARSKGGNAVICMRFDTSEMGDVWTETVRLRHRRRRRPHRRGAPRRPPPPWAMASPAGRPPRPTRCRPMRRASPGLSPAAGLPPSNRRATRNSRKATRRGTRHSRSAERFH